MSNYEDAIGRAQDLIDAGHNAALRADVDTASILVSLARVQLELASMFEPQSEVEVEGTDVSAELLVAALRDGSLKRMLVNDLTAARSASPGATADLMVGIVRGVLMGKAGSKAAAGFTDADLGGVPKVAKRAASEGDWMERDMPQPSSPDFKPSSEGESGRAYTCGLINDDGVMCRYPRHHRDWTNPASHSWNQENH